MFLFVGLIRFFELPRATKQDRHVSLDKPLNAALAPSKEFINFYGRT